MNACTVFVNSKWTDLVRGPLGGDLLYYYAEQGALPATILSASIQQWHSQEFFSCKK